MGWLSEAVPESGRMVDEGTIRAEAEEDGTFMENATLELLKNLLEIPSVNGLDNEKNIAKYLVGYFKQHFIEARMQYIDDTHANVIAFVPGKNRHKTMIWNGHLDTVPYGNLQEWATNPSAAVIKDGRIYARGAADMKSGLAAMVYALCHITEKPECNIRFLGTCDEERGGLGARKILEQNELGDGGCILIAEPTGMQLGTAQKGCLWLELQVQGKTSHGACPEQGINAITVGTELANQIHGEVVGFTHSFSGKATAQVTMMEGGVAPNMTPDACRVVMDIRMVTGLTAEMVLNQAQAAARQKAREFPGLSVEYKILNHRRAIEVAEHHPMVVKFRQILQGYGYAGQAVGVNFFTDASVLDATGTRQVLLFGPGESALAHQANEYVEIKKYEDAILVLQEFLQVCDF